MVLNSAITTSQPKWIAFIILNVLGSMRTNTGVAMPHFRNHLFDPESGEPLDEEEVARQQAMQTELLEKMDLLVREYDIRNKSVPGPERWYVAVERVITEGTEFFSPGITKRLLLPRHEDHVKTLNAIYCLMSMRAEALRNIRRPYRDVPMMPLPADDELHEFSIWVVDPEVDFELSGEYEGYPQSEAEIWGITPTRTDPNDLDSAFVWGRTVNITIRGRPTLKKLLIAFGAETTSDLLPRNIIGYNDWDPAHKPGDFLTRWPDNLVTGSSQIIGNQKHLNRWIQHQRRLHESAGVETPTRRWLGFVMHQRDDLEDLSDAALWPNLFKGYCSLQRFIAPPGGRDQDYGYNPEAMPLEVHWPNLTPEERERWGDLGTARSGVNHPLVPPPQLDEGPGGVDSEDFPYMAMVELGPQELAYLELDRNYETHRALRRARLDAQREAASDQAEELRGWQLLAVSTALEERKRIAHEERIAELQDRFGMAMEGPFANVDFEALSNAFIAEHQASVNTHTPPPPTPAPPAPSSSLPISPFGRRIQDLVYRVTPFGPRTSTRTSTEQADVPVAQSEPPQGEPLSDDALRVKLEDELQLAFTRCLWADRVFREKQEALQDCKTRIEVAAKEARRQSALRRFEEDQINRDLFGVLPQAGRRKRTNSTGGLEASPTIKRARTFGQEPI